jgi:Mg-chelatase subunit ChlD
MSFLAPIFFVGLAAVAVPILVHLIQRERKEVIQFPSLMFLRRIPYQSVERRRIHNWLLLALRTAAMALLVAAFSRPFLKQDPLQAAVPSAGAREVVILLDQSASMGYGDHWDKAREAARKIVGTLGAEDRGTLVLFGRNTEERVRATSDRSQLEVAINEAKVTSDGTRYGPALRYAQSLLLRSGLPRKEAVLISDFQKTGWEKHEEIHLPEGAILTPVSVASESTSDLSVVSIAFDRRMFSGEDRAVITAGLTNRGTASFDKVSVKLEIDGREIDSKPITLGANSSGSVTFAPFTVSEVSMRGVVRAGTDAMPKDNAYYFALSPGRPVSVLVITADNADSMVTFFLKAALEVSTAPAFKVDVVPLSRVTPSTLEHRAVVVLNDVTTLPVATNDLLQHFVQQGGGLLAALGEHDPWAGGESPLLPGKVGAPIDRSKGTAGTLGVLDYSHKVFELFKDVRNGNFSNVRFYQYRSLTVAPTDTVLARFDDGNVAMAERHVGSGRVIAWTSTADKYWNNFPVQPLYVPVVHELMTYLAQYTEPVTSYPVGRQLDISVPVGAIVREGTAGDTQQPVRKASGVVVAPSGQQTTIGEGGAPSIELSEQGFYSVRLQGMSERRPFAAAVNLDPIESDLAPLEPHQFVATVTGQAATTPTGQSLEHPNLTSADIEKKQGVWWFLLVGAVLALIAEALLSNRLSSRFGVGFLQMGPRATGR